MKIKTLHLVLAMKPLEGTFAQNALSNGVAGLNIDSCRINTFKKDEFEKLRARAETPRQDFTGGRLHSGATYTPRMIPSGMSQKGRFPANVILQDKAGAALNEQSGIRKTTWISSKHQNNRKNDFLGALQHPENQGYNDTGGAARFFKSFREE